MADVKIVVRPNGPLLIEGPITIIDSAGNPFALAPGKVALCRCGGSEKKPFCDGAHKKAGFNSDPKAPPKAP